ncbi:uncharacterized protein RCC_07822 [Ramularia collo-cygni]|uniref:Uncharacterized protein n=1 Tax=Ramularia collo-cygni TaxID=112498 RepID=A0A2D3VGC1_9PEZI|nr:uncharacterized protein RCC_07822 [Ramularia collo-cygni]CZT21954.1 uncharacterized protein RCC_07822 [Ramularia collo-cygni]
MSYTGPSNTTSNHNAPADFAAIEHRLTSTYAYPFTLPPKQSPHDRSLSNAIASLHVHPTLEAILHMLNNDLTSAHFLCRHMQSPPAFESMLIHGVLHRIEGDYDNASAWYGNVEDSDVFRSVWPDGLASARGFIEKLKERRKQNKGTGDTASLQVESEREMKALIEFCKKEFGTEILQDGTTAWVEPSEKIREIASKQLVGGEGWRKF